MKLFAIKLPALVHIFAIWMLCAAPLCATGIPLDNSFAPKIYGYGQVPEMAWNPVSEWLYCRVIAERMNGQDLTTNLIRFTEDGEWDDTWALDHDGDITCIAVQDDGKLLIGGDFTEVDGHSTFRVARINVDGSVDTTFSASGLPDTPEVDVVEALAGDSNGNVFVGFASNESGSIYRLSQTGSSATYRNFGDPVSTIALMDDESVLAGGGDKIRRYSNSLYTDDDFSVSVELRSAFGSLYSSAPPVQINEILVLKKSTNEYIWVAGRFDTINGYERHGLARLNADGELPDDSPIIFRISDTASYSYPEYINILDIDAYGDQLAFAGMSSRNFMINFDYYYSGEVGYIDISSDKINADDIYKQGSPKYVGSIEITDSKLVYGSNEIKGPTETQPALTFGDSDIGEQIELYRQRIPSAIFSRSDGGIFLAGYHIKAVNGQAVPGIVALDASMNVDTAFQPDFESLSLTQLMSLPDGRTLILGTINDDSRKMALLDQHGQLIEGFDFTFTSVYMRPSQQYMWLMPSGKLLISGINTLNEVPVSGLLLLDLDDLEEKLELAKYLPGGLLECGIIDPSFAPDPDFIALDAVGLDNGQMILTGSINDEPIIRLNNDGTVDESYRPQDQFSTFPLVFVERDMEGKIYLCPRTVSSFTHINGETLYILRLLPDGTPDSSYHSGSTFWLTRSFIALEDGRLLISGGIYRPDSRDWGVTLVDENGYLDDSFFLDDSLLDNAKYVSGTIYSTYIDRKRFSWGRAKMPEPQNSEVFITPAIAQANEGEDVTFWLADRGADETYQWLLGGEKLTGQTGPSLTIDPTTLANAGEISVEATNTGGTVIRTAELRVAGFDFNQWAAEQGYTPSELIDPEADLDRNGLSLNSEFLLRTDLGGVSNRSWAAPIWDGEALQLQWRMLPGRRYWVDCSTNLVSWTPVASYVGDAAETVSMPVEFDPDTPCFYQVRVELIDE